VGRSIFFEGVGGGLLADYVRAAKKKRKATGKLKNFPRTTDGAPWSTVTPDAPRLSARQWKIEIDGKIFPAAYILWGGNEYSLGWSRTPSGAARRNQRWAI
jgi:hypothetical protein